MISLTHVLEWYYADSESEEYKLQARYTSPDPFTFNGLQVTAEEGSVYLVDVGSSFGAGWEDLKSNINLAVTFSETATALQQDIIDKYTDLDYGTIGYQFIEDPGCVDGMYANMGAYTGNKLSIDFVDGGEPQVTNFRIDPCISMAIGVIGGPRFRIDYDADTLEVIDENDVSLGGISITTIAGWNEYEIQTHGDQYDFIVKNNVSEPSMTHQYRMVAGVKKRSPYSGFEMEYLDDGAINVDYIMFGDGKWETFW
jgi:hypothetical protein